MNYCHSVDIEYSTSVWDVVSAKEIVELNPNLIKVQSFLIKKRGMKYYQKQTKLRIHCQ